MRRLAITTTCLAALTLALGAGACTHRPSPAAPTSATGGATYGDAPEASPSTGVEPVPPDGDPCGY